MKLPVPILELPRDPCDSWKKENQAEPVNVTIWQTFAAGFH